jgi:Ca2+-binding RTX toxin-like protein
MFNLRHLWRSKAHRDTRYDLASIDLARDRIDVDGAVSHLVSFNELELSSFEAEQWRITGTRGPDVIAANATDRPVAINGRAGDDKLTGGRTADTVVGGTGSDGLRGRHGDDVLDGGADVDAGDGGVGNDTCHSIEGPLHGETSTHCETVTPKVDRNATGQSGLAG